MFWSREWTSLLNKLPKRILLKRAQRQKFKAPSSAANSSSDSSQKYDGLPPTAETHTHTYTLAHSYQLPQQPADTHPDMERSTWTQTGKGGPVQSTVRHCEEGQSKDSEHCPSRNRTWGGRTAALCTYAECLSRKQ